VLYLNRPEWLDAFRSPRYPVILGRSQDLACYTSVEVVELAQSAEVYFEHTLLPYSMATQTTLGVVALMPRWLDYWHNRQPTFARYVLLQQQMMSAKFLRFGDMKLSYWTDPVAPKVKGTPLGLMFHTFTGASDEALNLA
jgi:CRISPR-associated protein Cas5t